MQTCRKSTGGGSAGGRKASAKAVAATRREIEKIKLYSQKSQRCAVQTQKKEYSSGHIHEYEYSINCNSVEGCKDKIKKNISKSKIKLQGGRIVN